MTTRTLHQLSKAVLEKLALIDANADPSAADAQMISDRYGELMETLRDEDLCYWNDDAIPLLVFSAVADLVALHCMSAFGLGGNPVEIEDAEIPIKRRIRKHTRKPASGMPIPQENF